MFRPIGTRAVFLSADFHGRDLDMRPVIDDWIFVDHLLGERTYHRCLRPVPAEYPTVLDLHVSLEFGFHSVRKVTVESLIDSVIALIQQVLVRSINACRRAFETRVRYSDL